MRGPTWVSTSSSTVSFLIRATLPQPRYSTVSSGFAIAVGVDSSTTKIFAALSRIELAGLGDYLSVRFCIPRFEGLGFPVHFRPLREVYRFATHHAHSAPRHLDHRGRCSEAAGEPALRTGR